MKGSRATFFTFTFLERLVCYILAPEVVSRLIFEVLGGRDEFTITQDKQYIFYALIALDYIVSGATRKPLGIRVGRIGPLLLMFAVMILQGILVGIARQNSLLPIIVHTINVTAILINVYLLTDERTSSASSFDRLLSIISAYALIAIALAVAGNAISRHIPISLGSAAPAAICFAAVGTGFSNMRNARDLRLLVLTALVATTIPTWNRTTLLFLGISAFVILARNLVRNTFVLLVVALGSVIVLASAPTLLPPDSPLGQRLTSLGSIDLEEREGSVGERQAEADAVNDKIALLGWTGRFFGAGHGAVYDVQYTWKVVTDYANAHFSWVLFYLRYGMIGYLYLVALSVCLVIAFVTGVLSNRMIDIFLAYLALYNLLYLGTYAYFTFFICGLSFASRNLSVYDSWKKLNGKIGQPGYRL